MNIFVKQNKTKQITLLQKGFHLTVERVFSMWSWAELLVSHLVVIDFTLQTQRQSFLLCFPHYCVDRGTSLFDVSQCHICFCFFLFVFLMIPWLVTVTKKSLSTWSLQCKIVKVNKFEFLELFEFLIQIFMHKPVDKNINISHLNLVECAT